MAGYQRQTHYTDQGVQRKANFDLSIEEADAVADAIDYVMDDDTMQFSPSELITLSRVRAVLVEASDWVAEGGDDDGE